MGESKLPQFDAVELPDLSSAPADFQTDGSCTYVAYRLEELEGRVAKIPYNAETGTRASSTNPDDWGSLARVHAAVVSFNAEVQAASAINAANAKRPYDGIGKVIRPPYIGVDLDKCRTETGELALWAQEFLAKFPPTYTEVSPSGSGLHLWYRGKQPKGVPDGVRAPDLEVYFSARYFCCTFQPLEGTPREITAIDESQIRELLSVTESRKKKTKPATATVTKPTLREEIAFELLMTGKIVEAGFSDPTGDSDADLRLCGILAKKFNGNRQLIEQVWMNSGLKREKLQRADYRNRTLDKALENFQVKDAPVDPASWPGLFPSYQQFVEATLAGWVVDRWARRGDITMIGGLPKDGKTWIMLAIVRAMLTGTKLFGHFNVEPSDRVVYLIPEAGIAAIKRRLEKMRLLEFVKEGRLFVMPRSIAMVRKLDDLRIREAAKGADVFLDTAIRFIEGDENKSVEVKIFSENCLDLATVARTVWAAHHAPKSFAEATTMSLENMLRGSGDLAAMISNAFGIAKVNKETTEIHVESLGQRDDDEYLGPFRIQGRPHIDETGEFKMVAAPGQAGNYSDHKSSKKGGRPSDPEKDSLTLLLVELRDKYPDAGKEKLAELLMTNYQKDRSPSTISRYLKDHDAAKSAAIAARMTDDQLPF